MDNLFFLETKCIKEKKIFYMRFDKAAGGVWTQTYGVVDAPKGTAGAAINNTRFSVSNVRTGPQYKCPHCGNKSYIRCGECKKIACFNYGDQQFTCPYCGCQSNVSYDKFIEELDGQSGIGQG